MLVILYRTWR
jgi:hypothetical protein